MDPRKQKQMVSQLFENTAKSQEEIDKMTPEEKKEYLSGRLKQRMFFNGVSRQSMQQKKKMQDKIEEASNQTGQEGASEGVTISKCAEKNKKKKLRKQAAKDADKAAQKIVEQVAVADEDDIDDVVIVKRESESDYESEDD